MANEKVDVVIVGAGASGSVFAVRHGQGRQEGRAAGQWTGLAAFGPRQFRSLGAAAAARRSSVPVRRQKPVRLCRPGRLGRRRCALHYFGNHPRFLPNDFKIKSEHNRALDWPISYQDVAPFYDRVAHDIGMSGDARAEEKWRPAGKSYPLPPLKTFRHGEIWVKGFEAMGVRMAPAPVAINSAEYQGRKACVQCGWCSAGLRDRRARQSARHLSGRSPKGQG